MPVPSGYSEEVVALNNSLITKKQLALHNGDPNRPVYLAVRGYVFDVSRDREVFGKGGPLNVCAGCEVSRAIALGPHPVLPPPNASCSKAFSSLQGSTQEHLAIDWTAEGSDAARKEGLRSRAGTGQDKKGGKQSIQQPAQMQQEGTDKAPPLRITLQQCEIGQSKLHDCSDLQLAKVEEVLKMCRDKYTQVGRLPEEFHIDPLPIIGDKHLTACMVLLAAIFVTMFIAGFLFAVLPRFGWGSKWFMMREGLSPGSVFDRAKLNRILNYQQLLPDEDYE